MILKNIRYLVTQNREREVLENVDLRVENDEIADIGDDLDPEGEEILDCSNKVVLPGLINCHTHVSMSLLRGISDNKKLQDWLHEDIFPAEEEMTDEDIYQGARLGIAEMLKTGTTCFNDMYAPEEQVAKAVDETGIRAVLGEGFVDIHGDLDEKLERSREFIEKYKDHERITPAVNPHAAYTCSEEALERAKQQADEYNVPIHVHVSETREENEDSIEEHGETPTEHLNGLGLLDHETIAAHCVHLSNKDVDILKRKNVGVAHNPSANLKLGSGIAEIPELRSENIHVGLGTDGPASNNNLNLFEEAKTASLIQKNRDPESMTEQEVLDMVTCEAAEVLGLEDSIGSLEEGKKADLITVDLSREDMMPIHDERGVLSNLVFSFNGSVSETIVNGEKAVSEGEIDRDSGVELEEMDVSHLNDW